MKPAITTIIGFGSLQSIASARTTFPNLTNFRVVRLSRYRRVFRHPAAIFFERGIADLETKEIASLSAEPVDADIGFSAVAFDVTMASEDEMGAFYAREEEFSVESCEFTEASSGKKGRGLMCLASTDADYKRRWGSDTFDTKYGVHGLETIWGWGKDSGILPCAVYLRHCILAVSKPEFPAVLRDSFLDETFLADRSTTIRTYLAKNKHVMESRPPASLAGRYSG